MEEQRGLFDVPEGHLFDPSHVDCLTQNQRNILADEIEFGGPRLFAIARMEREAFSLSYPQAV